MFNDWKFRLATTILFIRDILDGTLQAELDAFIKAELDPSTWV